MRVITYQLSCQFLRFIPNTEALVFHYSEGAGAGCVLVHALKHVFPVRVLGLKKLFLKHYNPYTQFAPFLFSPSRITDKKENPAAFSDIILQL